MKILIILCSHEFNINNCDNVTRLNNFLVSLPGAIVEYCGISNTNDFHNYESIISFKYKVVNTKKQFNKICDFITDQKSELDYDWYIKFRPDIKIIELNDFNLLSDKAINARARVYNGPKKIKYGMSVNGEGVWKNIGDCFHDDCEKEVVLDDMMFIFHNNVIQVGAFDKIPYKLVGDNEWYQTNEWRIHAGENEWYQTNIWKIRNIPLNVIGINLKITKHDCFSGDINM